VLDNFEHLLEAARLEQRLTLLTDGARDLPPRHQTLRAAIAWSHELLDAGEQTLFARLGVFVGGWTLEAAEAVCYFRRVWHCLRHSSIPG